MVESRKALEDQPELYVHCAAPALLYSPRPTGANYSGCALSHTPLHVPDVLAA